MVMLADLHAATLRLIVKLNNELEVERNKEEDAIAEASRTHLAIGDNYWKRRYMVEQKLRAAQLMLVSSEEPVV